MLPYLIAGAIGFVVAKVFEEDEAPKYADGGSVLLAPNGNPSNLTPEQYELVRTPAFKKWFGDWENSPETSSKVVDENGEPLVLYHGTSEKFTIFKDEGVVAKTMGKSVGFYFTPSKFSASTRSVDGEYIEVFLNIKKLHRLKKFSNDEDFIEILGNKLKKAIGLPERAETYWYLKNGSGYDGREEYNVGSVVKELSLKKGIEGYYFLEFMGINEGVIPVYQVFESKNVKLADGTNTTFDASNPDIRFDDGGELDDDIFDATKLDLDNPISSRVYYKGVDNQINKILKNDYEPVYDFDKKGIEWVYKNTRYEVKDEDLILELNDALVQRNRSVVDMMRINNQLPRIESKYGKDINLSKKMYQEAKDFYENKLRNEKSNRANDVWIDYLISRLKETKKEETPAKTKSKNENVNQSKKELYNQLIEGYELSLEIETNEQKIKMYRDLIEGYELALELEDEEIQEEQIIEVEQIQEEMKEEVAQDDFQPSYLMTLDEYREKVTPLIQAYKKFVKKNNDWLVKPDYYGLAHYSLEEALEQIDDEDSAFARKSKYSDYKNKKEKEETIRKNYSYKKTRDFNEKYTQAPTPPNLIIENKEFIQKLKKYFSVDELNSKVEDDETKSNKRAVRRAIDKEIYKDLLSDKKVELSKLEMVAESVGVRLPKSIFDEATQNQMKYEAELNKLLSNIPSLSFEKLKELIEQIKFDLKPLEEQVYEREYARYSKILKDNIGVSTLVDKLNVAMPIWIFLVDSEVEWKQVEKTNYRGRIYSSKDKYIKITSLKYDWEKKLSAWVREQIDMLKNSIILAIMNNFQNINMPIQSVERLRINVGYKGFEGSYKFVFENGSSFIMNFQGVGAGGFNIQKYHFRYLTNFSNVLLADGSQGGTNYYEIADKFSTKRN